MLRTRVSWTGFSGAPGVSTFHWDATGTQANVDAALAATNDFADNARYPCPPSVTLHADQAVDEVDAATGALINVWNSTSLYGPLVGVAAAPYAGPAGACITWRTASVHLGRLVRGRTFVVPLSVDAYEADSTLTATALARITTAAAALISAAPVFGIWSKPRGASPGVISAVVARTISDRAAVLRSRRD